MSRTYKAGEAIEFCPVSCRDTSVIKWRAGAYVGSIGAGWHHVKVDAFGTIEAIPGRRIRPAGAKP